MPFLQALHITIGSYLSLSNWLRSNFLKQMVSGNKDKTRLADTSMNTIVTALCFVKINDDGLSSDSGISVFSRISLFFLGFLAEILLRSRVNNK